MDAYEAKIQLLRLARNHLVAVWEAEYSKILDTCYHDSDRNKMMRELPPYPSQNEIIELAKSFRQFVYC